MTNDYVHYYVARRIKYLFFLFGWIVFLIGIHFVFDVNVFTIDFLVWMRSIGHYVFTLLADLFVAYRVLYDNPTEDIITRLCKVRNITDSPDDFLQPSFGRYWTP